MNGLYPVPDDLFGKRLLLFLQARHEAVYAVLGGHALFGIGFLLSLIAAAPAARRRVFRPKTGGTTVPSIPDIMATESNRW